MRPCELGELELVVPLLERCHEENESENVHGKADEAMMGRKWEQNLINQENMLEVIDHAFTIDKIHGDGEEIPVERLCKREVLLLSWNLRNSNNFLEGDYENCSDDHEHVYMTSEHGAKEA